MKKYLIAILAAFTLVNVAHADVPTVYGDLWSSVTDTNSSPALGFDFADLGVKASLGGSASADVAYDVLHNSLYTAAASYKGLLSLTGAPVTDSLSLGLQASAYGALLDTTLGQSAFSCFSCVHSKSLTYSVTATGYSTLALSVNEANNYSGTLSVPVLPGYLTLLGTANYDNPTSSWHEGAAAQATYGPVAAVLKASHCADGTWDYEAAGKAAVWQGLGVVGNYHKDGSLLLGPTYLASSNLLVGVVGGRAQTGDVTYEGRVSAKF